MPIDKKINGDTNVVKLLNKLNNLNINGINYLLEKYILQKLVSCNDYQLPITS